jgi:hypothetical protein
VTHLLVIVAAMQAPCWGIIALQPKLGADMKTEFPGAVPEIPRANVDKAVDHYKNILGFDLDWVARRAIRVVLTKPGTHDHRPELLGNSSDTAG